MCFFNEIGLDEIGVATLYFVNKVADVGKFANWPHFLLKPCLEVNGTQEMRLTMSTVISLQIDDIEGAACCDTKRVFVFARH